MLITLLAHAADRAPNLPAVPNPPERIEFESFSAVPPAGDHWYIDAQGPFGIAIVRIPPETYRVPGDELHTIVVTFEASLAKPEWVRTYRAFSTLIKGPYANPTAGSFQVQDYVFEDQQISGRQCLRFEEDSRDRRDGVRLVVTTIGVVCRLPSAQRIVKAVYSERRPEGGASWLDGELRTALEESLYSLLFASAR